MSAHTFSAAAKLDQCLYECCCMRMVSACIATTAAAEGAIVPAPDLQVFNLLRCQTGVKHMQNGTKQEQETN